MCDRWRSCFRCWCRRLSDGQGPRSREIFERAQRYMPGGVSSPVRAFRAVGGNPPVIAYGSGPRIYDVDGREYIDYVCAYGPLILGHAHPAVAAVLGEAALRGTAYGATSELEVELASRIVDAMPSIELVRFVNSGTEATMSALRLARAFTGRSKIIKFEGGYHGHADGLLVQAGSGQATLSLPDSPGVPASYAAETLLAPYNDLAAVRALFEANADADRGGHRRAGGGEHGRRAAGARVPRRAARADVGATARCWSSTR